MRTPMERTRAFGKIECCTLLFPKMKRNRKVIHPCYLMALKVTNCIPELQ
jgi:hypothetical protein